MAKSYRTYCSFFQRLENQKKLGPECPTGRSIWVTGMFWLNKHDWLVAQNSFGFMFQAIWDDDKLTDIRLKEFA